MWYLMRMILSRQASIALNKKHKLEKGLFVNLRPIFNDMVAKSGSPLFNPSSMLPSIRNVIDDHYKNVFAEFGDDFRDEHKVDMGSFQQAAFEGNANASLNQRSVDQASIIDATNQSQLKKIRAIANDQVEKAKSMGQVITRSEMITIMYRNALFRRLPVIACTETQWSAEFSKFIEVAYLAGFEGIATKANNRAVKRWDAMGDDIMRDHHALADSTTKPFDEPFRVLGELLMRPGDTSLGATAVNIINCRCTVTYGVSSEVLTRVSGAFRDIFSTAAGREAAS